MYARSYFNAIKSLLHHFRALIEGFLILFRPPVNHISILVKMTALIVESVRHLVTDYHADSAVVKRIVGIHIEERILENTGGETDLIAGRIVICIHRLWRHVPFGFVHRFA